MKKLWSIFVLAFLVRIILAPIYHHGDADNYFYWSKYLWEKKDFLFFLGKGIPNAMPATYPPLFYYLLFLWRGFYELVGQMLWWLNLKISLFPSNFIFWYQSYDVAVAFNKIPAILADLGSALLIYKIAVNIGIKKSLAKISCLLFLFLPATWYNSAYWGQIDSLYAFFVLLGFSFALKNRFLWGILALAVSALIKPTGLFVLPAFLIFAVKKKKVFDLLVGMALSLILALILYFPYFPLGTLSQTVAFYFGSFQGELNQLVANAFNFWGLLFGFDQRPDNFPVLGIPLNFWAFLLFILISMPLVIKLWQEPNKKTLLMSAFLLAFAAFLFLPRMHERYFYPTLIFLAIVAGMKKSWLYLFTTLSLIHWLNLYHFWWSPQIPSLISLLTNLTIVRLLIILEVIIFGYFYRQFLLLVEAKQPLP